MPKDVHTRLRAMLLLHRARQNSLRLRSTPQSHLTRWAKLEVHFGLSFTFIVFARFGDGGDVQVAVGGLQAPEGGVGTRETVGVVR